MHRTYELKEIFSILVPSLNLLTNLKRQGIDIISLLLEKGFAMTRTFSIFLRVVVFFIFIGFPLVFLKGQDSCEAPCFLENPEDDCCYDRPQGQRVYAGPEIYYLRRTREGGTKQQG